jgi:hypothetical protein
MLAFYMTTPIVLLAKRAGAPGIRDPFWGPIMIAWFAACGGLLAILMYVLPRRVYLAIHERGFVYRGRFRRHCVGYGEIAQCIVAPKSRGLTLVLRNSTRLWFPGFMILFPQEGVVQLLEQINQLAGGGELQVAQVDGDMKARMRRAGWAIGLVLYAIIVITPIRDAKCRQVALKAFGETVCGMPFYVFAPLLLAILFAPLVYVATQLIVLTTSRMRLRTTVGLYNAQELRKARIVVVLGGIYFLALAGIWIAYTSALGI